MPKLLKEPLVQFLIGGLLLYIALTVFGTSETEDDPYVIPVNDRALLMYLQYQDKAFDTASASAALGAMDSAARKRLKEEYIRDEVMVREALALGLNENDEVIRRRLIQKMDFIVQGFTSQDAQFSSREIEDHFKANAGAYQIEAEASFTHIFFSNEKRGKTEAQQQAEALLAQLNQSQVPFEKAGEYGDRFYFLRNYVKRPKRLISNHFGTEITKKIFALEASRLWVGPFTSKYGTHLLLLRDKEVSRAPLLKDITPQIIEDLRRIQQDKARADAIQKLSKKYTLDHSVEGN